jgi:Mn2+/Fe2+ NRAMP family transporter
VGTVFALGLIEAGAVAVLTISASTGYAAAECIGAPHSMNLDARNAGIFYGATIGAAAIAAVTILIPGAPLLKIALNANVLATVLLPVALVFVILLANDRDLMGRFANGAVHNAFAIAIAAFVGLSGAAYAVDSFLQTAHII